MKCIIVGACDFAYDVLPEDVWNDSYVIAADAGIMHLIKLGITPHVAIGDWDSLLESDSHRNLDANEVKMALEKLQQEYKSDNSNGQDPSFVVLPVEKDVTDTLAAAQYGLEQGYQEFHFVGCLGGKRMDHSIANIQTLLYLEEHGGHGFLYSDDQVMEVLCASSDEEKYCDDGLKAKDNTSDKVENYGKRCFEESMKGDFSLFAISEKCEGVTISGMQYEIQDVTLTPAFPLGVSNHFVGMPASITMQSGVALMVYSRK